MIKVFYFVCIFSFAVVQNLNSCNLNKVRSDESEFANESFTVGTSDQYLFQVDLEDNEENKLKHDFTDFNFTAVSRITGIIKITYVFPLTKDNFLLHFTDSSPPFVV